MHSHHGITTTQDFGFRIWEWGILLLGISFTSSSLTTTSLSHPYLQVLVVLQQSVALSAKMVFAVARTTARKAANVISHGGHNGPGQSAAHRLPTGAPIRHASTAARATHAPGSLPPKPIRSPPNKLFTVSRNFFARVFNQLSAPGLRVPTHFPNTGAATSRSLHIGASPTIKSGLSLHARTALSSGPRHFLPRPPSPGVRVATNVGLGTARNFSTARPIFQNLVENVPVAARSFYEADLDLRARKSRCLNTRRVKSSTQRKTKEMLKPRNAPIPASPQEDPEAEISHYFNSVIAPVTTYLLVPLAPTPSSRVPLPPDPVVPIDSPTILPPLSYVTSFHAAHEHHAARVQSLFLRLDQAKVWNAGVKKSYYGQGTDEAGYQCTLCRIEFVGWTEAEVRAVIGESGTGWCSLEEHRFDDVDEMSEFSSVIDPLELAGRKGSSDADVSSSFMMPTLDVSTSLHDPPLPPSPSLDSVSLPSSAFSSRPMSPISEFSDYSDPWREDGSDASPNAGSRRNVFDNSSERGWQQLGVMQFSARHLNQWD